MDKTTCKHFNGTYHNTHCEAGICYRDVTTEPDRLDGSGLRIPCRSEPIFNNPNQLEEFAKRGTCEKFQFPTDAEIEADEAIWEEIHRKSMERFTKIGPLVKRIKKDNKGKGNSGIAECPCCKGKLHWSIASVNGHVHMTCETDDCINFME